MKANLYRVKCRGMLDKHGIAYVIAPDPATAYERLRRSLDERDLGFRSDRGLESVELIAEDDELGDGRRLYLPEAR